MPETVALAIHLEDVDVVGQAVEQRAGEPLGAEHLGPFVEGQVRGHQGGAALVTLAEARISQLTFPILCNPCDVCPVIQGELSPRTLG